MNKALKYVLKLRLAFMAILAKLSDNVGRRLVLVASLAVFTIFSGACGAAQTMNQL